MRIRPSEKAAVAVVFVASIFMSALDTTIVNVALPDIGRSFSVTPTAVDGISIGYMVSLAVFMPASGWLGDRFGGKRVLLTATVIFTIASALCGLASSVGELDAFRVLQGIGGGMMAPVGMAMLFRVFPQEERMRVTAILTVPTALAPAAGPVLGGLLVSELSWRWVFFVNLPAGVATVVFGALFLRHDPQHSPGDFDLAGFVLAGTGLGLLMYGVSEGPNSGWGSPIILGCVVAGGILLVVMVKVELRSAAPMVAVRVLGNRLFRNGTMALVLMTAAFLGTLYAMSLYLQDGKGLGALASGLTIFPEAVGVSAGSMLASRVLYPRLGPRRHTAVGLINIAVAIGLLALLSPGASLWWTRLFMFFVGVGMGQVMLATQTASFATISAKATGRASTLFQAVRQVGGAAGVALLTTVIALAGPTRLVNGHLAANLTAYRLALGAAAVCCLAGLPFAFAIRDSDAAATIPVRPRKTAVPGRPT
ncbi:MAG: MDR family MFS transporter [Streptosporangiaceae bacterium]